MSDDRGDSGQDAWLSALIDGELSPSDREVALDRLARDSTAQAQWARYHAQRAALNDERVDRLSPWFVERVAMAVAEEPAIMAPRRRWIPRSPGWRRVGGAAVAATVALVTAALLMVQQGDEAVRSPGGGGATPDFVDDGVSAVSLTAGSTPAASGPGRSRIGQYLSRHAEVAGVSGMPGLMPFTRLSGFNAQQH